MCYGLERKKSPRSTQVCATKICLKIIYVRNWKYGTKVLKPNSCYLYHLKWGNFWFYPYCTKFCFLTTILYSKDKEFHLHIILCYLHCVTSAQIRSFFWSIFSWIRTEYGEIRSVKIRTRKNSVFGHISHRDGTTLITNTVTSVLSEDFAKVLSNSFVGTDWKPSWKTSFFYAVLDNKLLVFFETKRSHLVLLNCSLNLSIHMRCCFESTPSLV